MNPSTIPYYDQAELTWFYGEGTSCFERSSFGDQLHRAAVYAYWLEKCNVCFGTGFRETPDKLLRAFREGLGPFRDDFCDICRGAGHTKRARRSSRRPTVGRPGRAQVQSTDLVDRDWPTVERYGRISRRVFGLSPSTRLTYGELWGSTGCHWETVKGRGREFAVWPLVDAGQRLLAQSYEAVNRKRVLTKCEILHVELELDQLCREPDARQLRRRKLLALARQQAAHAIQQADGDWTATSQGPRDVPTLEDRLEAASRRLMGMTLDPD